MVKAREKKGSRKNPQQESEQKAYDDYIKEREHLSKYEQTNYDNYERAILTLSAAFLAFSVSFLGLVRNKPTSSGPMPLLVNLNLLIGSWISFASSILFLLLCFLINAMALRSEVVELENRLDGKAASDELNKWNVVGYLLYVLSGLSFVLGLVMLLMFCARHIHIF